MYRTTRRTTGSTVMTCRDCGHTVTMNKICETPLQSATDMLKHMSSHNTARAFAIPAHVAEPVLIPAVASAEALLRVAELALQAQPAL